MRLVRVRKGVWDVLAVRDTSGPIDWATFRSTEDTEVKKMRALVEYVALNGPPMNKQKCEQVRPGIYELKCGQKSGPKLRLFWFYGPGRRVIICTHSATKKSRSLPRDYDRAERLRDSFSVQNNAGAISVCDISDLEAEND